MEPFSKARLQMIAAAVLWSFSGVLIKLVDWKCPRDRRHAQPDCSNGHICISKKTPFYLVKNPDRRRCCLCLCHDLFCYFNTNDDRCKSSFVTVYIAYIYWTIQLFFSQRTDHPG